MDTRGNSYMTGYFGDTVFFGDYNLTSVGETVRGGRGAGGGSVVVAVCG